MEIFEFAARLAQSPAGSAQMHVALELKHLQGRRLTAVGHNVLLLSGDYRTQMSEWSYPWQGSQTELIARPRELAAESAKDLFARFGWNLSVDILRTIQDGLFR
jgi:hypothetical protein